LTGDLPGLASQRKAQLNGLWKKPSPIFESRSLKSPCLSVSVVDFVLLFTRDDGDFLDIPATMDKIFSTPSQFFP